MKGLIMLGFVCSFAAIADVDDLKSRIENTRADHPRLFVRPGDEERLRRKIDSNPLLVQALRHVTTTAEVLLAVEPVERKKVGRRLLGVSRTCLKRVLHLSLAYRLTGDDRLAARAETEMLAAAAFTDWNPGHFLDVAEMTAALAIGYDWLYEELDPHARRTIKAAIIDKGLKTSLKGGWWVGTTNNWNQVCHGGLTLGALAVLEDQPDLAAEIIERAIRNVPKAMAEYAPDGAYPEGPGYWNYGTTYNVILISALQSVFGTDFGLSESQGFLSSADYYLHVTGPTGLFFNYSDCGSGGGVSPAMYWFAARRREPWLLWNERRQLELFLSRNHNAGGASNRMFPFLIVWAGDFVDMSIPEATHWQGDGRTPLGLHRSGWGGAGETFVGVKGGSPGTSHAHMDIGTFVMDALGVRWAVDLGSQSYHGLESKGVRLWDKGQDGQRWEVFRLNNLSHNTLVVDGKKQRVSGHAPILRFSDEAPMAFTIVDLSGVYEGQLKMAKRGVAVLEDRSVLIRDEITALDRDTSVRWGMVTKAEVTIQDERQAILSCEGQQLVLKVESPADARLELFETAEPPGKYDAPNQGTRMIGFWSEILAAEQATFSVMLSPGAEGGARPESKSLADW